MPPLNDRRSFLKGVSLGAGAVVLQPIVAQLAAHAAGDVRRAPRRVVFMVESNGLFPHHVQPKGLERPKDGSDKVINVPLADYELPDPIAALSPFTDRLTVVQGLSGCVCEGGSGGHSTGYGGLGCYPGSKGPMDQTVDSIIAEALGGVIPHVGLGIQNRQEITVDYSISASGPGKPLPILCKPELAFESLFGSVLGGGGRQAFDLKTNLLDFMARDVRRVRGGLAGLEREKLDTYLEAFETFHNRQAKIDAISESLKKHSPNRDKFASNVETDRLESQFDIAAAALIAGLTNAVTLASGGGCQHYISYAGLGLPIDGHGIGHGSGVNGKSAEECRVIIRQFHAKLIAGLATKLQAVPEGDGTMLDNTLIVYLSDSGDSHHPNLREWPIVLLGDWGGK
ncbi:MAG: DUF1552 domain-containing protein, partial [Afipia sp.]|nr:DUF1552 domain-containing protein [Afipia sp.]